MRPAPADKPVQAREAAAGCRGQEPVARAQAIGGKSHVPPRYPRIFRRSDRQPAPADERVDFLVAGILVKVDWAVRLPDTIFDR